MKVHRAASIVLRRLLAQYESISRADLCHLMGNVLLEDFKNEKHCRDIVLSNTLIRDLVVFCRVATRACEAIDKAASSAGGVSANLVPGTSTELLRLRKVGEKLFAATFVIHSGFLPVQRQTDDLPREMNVVECPWDSGELDLPLLEHVPLGEDALHLARRVLLRGLFWCQRGDDRDNVPAIARLWALGRWPSCRDATLISEAFKFLGSCWRDLRARKATDVSATAVECQSRLKDEEALFKMFSDLEFWRLPPGDLLTPWVPPQLLACHMAARCKLLDEQQQALSEDNRHNLEEINRLRQIVTQLSAKLEQVGARSIQSVQKQAEVADTLRALR